ncbi:uncharacterized protein METZ01_LOCUS310186, partial [marine metagenome]
KKTESMLTVLELPTYQRPSWREIGLQIFERGKIFVKNAGTVILCLSIILWALKTYPKNTELLEKRADIKKSLKAKDISAEEAVGELGEINSRLLEYSVAGRMGKGIEPVIEPLGYDWKMGIGLIASFAAREMFVGTMSIIYLGEDKTGDEKEEEKGTIRKRMAVEKREDGKPAYNIRTCLSLLIFYVFAMQCLSTVAVTRRETNSWHWAIFQVVYLTGFAYVAALATYQISGFFIP